MKRFLCDWSYKKILGILLGIIGIIMLLAFIPVKFWLVCLGALFILIGILLLK